jgi:hypothetical protein
MASRREDGCCGGAADKSNNREGVQEGDAVTTSPPALGGSARHCRVSAPRNVLVSALRAICTDDSALHQQGMKVQLHVGHDSRPCA